MDHHFSLPGSPPRLTWVRSPPTPASRGPILTGRLAQPGGAELTTPTEVKAATELMMVGMMLNLPACMYKDQGEWTESPAAGRG